MLSEQLEKEDSTRSMSTPSTRDALVILLCRLIPSSDAIKESGDRLLELLVLGDTLYVYEEAVGREWTLPLYPSTRGLLAALCGL